MLCTDACCVAKEILLLLHTASPAPLPGPPPSQAGQQHADMPPCSPPGPCPDKNEYKEVFPPATAQHPGQFIVYNVLQAGRSEAGVHVQHCSRVPPQHVAAQTDAAQPQDRQKRPNRSIWQLQEVPYSHWLQPKKPHTCVTAAHPHLSSSPQAHAQVLCPILQSHAAIFPLGHEHYQDAMQSRSCERGGDSLRQGRQTSGTCFGLGELLSG